MVIELGAEVCETIVAVFVALRCWGSRRAGAGIPTYLIDVGACRTISQVSIERFPEMLHSWTFGAVGCALLRDIFIACQVDVGGSRWFWTSADASIGIWMGSYVVGAGMVVP